MDQEKLLPAPPRRPSYKSGEISPEVRAKWISQQRIDSIKKRIRNLLKLLKL